MKKIILFGVVLTILFGDDLKSLLEYATKHNNLINATKISIYSKEKELQSIKNSYFPTLDISGFYKRDDDAAFMQPGTVYGAKVVAGWNAYDSGRKEFSKKQKQNEIKAAKFSSEDTKKTIILNITKNFYNLLSLKASLDALIESSKAVKAQLNRVKRFFKANLATSDEVDRLQSAYDNTAYAIESLKFQIASLKKTMQLQIGKKIDSLQKSKFIKKDNMQENTELDSIRALKNQKKALLNLSKKINSYNHLQLHIQDTYAIYGYENKPTIMGKPANLLDNQNEIMLTLSMRLYDFGVSKRQQEAIRLQANALNEKILFQSKEQKTQIELAILRIKMAKLHIKSSKSALNAAKSALKNIEQKYNARVVDNIVYLDALSNKTKAKATYEKALNELEIAYAMYYYYNGKDLQEMIQ